MQPFKRVCIPGELQGIGGPASFQRKLTSGLNLRGVEVTFDLDDEPYDSVLVINATRHLWKLRLCKAKGIRIVQRLGVLNRLQPSPFHSAGRRLLALLRDFMMRWIRSFIADHVVYQSRFVQTVWNERYGEPAVPSSVTYNGVDLTCFNPQGPAHHSPADICMISVEGNQGTDPSDTALQLGEHLRDSGASVELMAFGNPRNNIQLRFARCPFARFFGPISNHDLPYYYRGSTFHVSSDFMSACPNSAIEAMACGTPVVGFATGSLPELLGSSGGLCVPFDRDACEHDRPGIKLLTAAASEVSKHRDKYAFGARGQAEKMFNVEAMTDSYLQVLLR